jgi:hypothetical protein
LDGREPEQITEHEYDGDRLVRSVTVREPEWTDQDRAEVLALALYRATRCPCGCGNDVRETTASRGTYTWRPRKLRCLARDALAIAQEEHSKKTTHPEAVLWRVEKG